MYLIFDKGKTYHKYFYWNYAFICKKLWRYVVY